MSLMSRGFAAALAFAGALAIGTGAADAQRQLTIGTNPVGTGYHTVGSGMAALLTEQIGIPVVVQPFSGSSVYIPLLQEGEVTMGFVSSLDAGGAYRGEQGREPMPDLRAMARVWRLPYGLMVRADSGIESIADLEGRRVVISFAGNVSLNQANVAILRAGGLEPGSYQGIDVGGLPDGVQAVVEGDVDATFIALGIGLVRQADANVGIRFLDLPDDPEYNAALGAEVPGLYVMDTMPGEANPGIGENHQVAGFDVLLLTGLDTDPELVGRIVTVLHENWVRLQGDFADLRSGPQDGLASPTNTVPYHDGAIAVWRELGLWSPANDEHEASFR